MANLLVKDANGDIVEIKASGAGTTGDPFIIERVTVLGAGSAAIGKLGANSGVDIGDVTLNGPLGRAADAASISAALSTEDVALLDGIEGLLTAIDGHVDGLETVEGAVGDAAVITDTNGSLSAKLRGLIVLWLAGLKASEAHIGQVGGTTLLATGTMTRPGDTNVYAAGDGVTTATSSASAMTVTGAARVAAGSGIIFGGVAEKSTTGVTNASFRIWIYQAAPTAIPNDNAAFTAAVHADYQKLVATATFDFAAGIVGSDGVRVPINLERPNAAFKIASGSDLIVIWEARAAYTPGNAEVFRLALDIAQD
jgi:hypothetical protein